MVTIVSVDTGEPGDTVGGLNVAFIPVGSSNTARLTTPENPFTALTDTATVADPLRSMRCVPGVSESLKGWGRSSGASRQRAKHVEPAAGCRLAEKGRRRIEWKDPLRNAGRAEGVFYWRIAKSRIAKQDF